MEPSAIVQELQNRDRLSFEDLLRLFPYCTWNRVVAAVDRLSRNGTLTLRAP